MVRDGAVESVHCGHAVVVDPRGTVVAAAGDPEVAVYPRSALKPFQAAAVVGLAGPLPADELAVIAASHTGAAAHTARVRAVLARADLSVEALRCPPAPPTDAAALAADARPSALTHNCSGKHAGFLLATRAWGGEPADYLAPAAIIQRAVRDVLRRSCAVDPAGPGVDGCGAPAWRMPLRAVAHGFARLAAGTGALGSVRDAMRAHPDLVGGVGIVDTSLMRAAPGVVAKRGAEGVLALAVGGPRPLGAAVKVADGSPRPRPTVAAALLARCGVAVPPDVTRRIVLGGGVPRGEVRATDALRRALAEPM